MPDKKTAKPNPGSFCTSCGSALSAADRFCASCGQAAQATDPADAGATTDAGATAPATDAAPVGAAGSSPALPYIILTVALAFGIGAFVYTADNDKPPSPRAVPGAPSTAPPPSEPPERKLEMPSEVKELLGELTTTAEENPKDVDAWLKLTRAHYRASVLNVTYRSDAKEALAHLLEIAPGNLEAVRISGNIAYDEHDFVTAEKKFRFFLESEPNDVGVITDLGSSLLFRDRIEEAIKEYKKAVELTPEFLQAWFNLGVAYQKLGNTDEAVKALTTARSLADDPDRKAFIGSAIAAAQGETGTLPAGHPVIGKDQKAGTIQGTADGTPKNDAGAKTNASTNFQRSAQKLLLDHRIVGSRISQIVWSGAAEAKVTMLNFPMDQMPPAVRNGFMSRINDELASLAARESISETIKIDMVDSATSRVMATFDGQ